MYQLEDRILFDGAAVVDAAAAQQAFNEQQMEAQETQDSQVAEEQNPNKNENDASHVEGSAPDAEGATDADGSQNHDAALGLDSDDVQDFLSSSVSESVADDSLKVYIVASDSLELDALRDAANDNTLIIEYNDDTTKADLMRMLSETLNGRKADSILFLDADGDDSAGNAAAGSADATEDLAKDITGEEFADDVQDFLAADGDADYLDMTVDGSMDDLHDILADHSADTDADSDFNGDLDDVDDADDSGSIFDSDDDNQEITDNGQHDVIDDYGTHLGVLDTVPEKPHEIIFIDSRVQDIDQIIASLDPSAEIVFLSGKDTLNQVNEYLAQYDGEIDAIHFITHGTDGVIKLGDQEINTDYLLNNRDQFAQWGNSLSEHGDIMFYGCSIAGGQAGQSLVNALAAITGADIAASSRPVGNGNWSLDYNHGTIDAATITVGDYDHFLANYQYRSKGDGDWHDTKSWEVKVGEEWLDSEKFEEKYHVTFVAPDSDAISITVNNKITVSQDFTIGSDLIIADKGVLTVTSDMNFIGGPVSGDANGHFIKVEAGGTLEIGAGATLTVASTGDDFHVFTSNGTISIAKDGTLEFKNGYVEVNGSINPTPKEEGKAPTSSNMLTPVGTLVIGTSAGANIEFHFTGAEIATHVHQYSGTFFYDGSGEQAISGGITRFDGPTSTTSGESFYNNVVVSGGTKTLWGAATVNGSFTFQGNADVRLGGFVSGEGFGQYAELHFTEDASIVNGGGAFINDYEGVTVFKNDKDEEYSVYTTVVGGMLSFDLAQGKNPFRVKVGRDVFTDGLRSREWNLYQLKAVSGNVTIDFTPEWSGDISGVGEDIGYSNFKVRVESDNWNGAQMAMNILGYSKGGVSQDFSYALASIYVNGYKLSGDNQFEQIIDATNDYIFLSKPIDASCLLVTSTSDDPTQAGIGTLRVAVDYANRFGGEVTFDKTLSGKTIELLLGEMQISGNVTIVGLTGREVVTVSGGDRSQIFNVNYDSTLVLSDTDLTRGGGNGSGGAIFNGGILKLNNVNITHSNAYDGGAIYGGTDSVSKLFNVTLDHNSAAHWGGAVYVASGALVSGERVRITNNSALKGGGAFIGFGAGTTDEDGKPVVSTEAGSLQLKSSTLDRNSADEGSALYIAAGGFGYTVKEKVTINGEETEVEIPMVMNISGSAMFDSVTISRNTSTQDPLSALYTGSAVHTAGKFYGVNVTMAENETVGFFVDVAGLLTLENSTIAFNLPPGLEPWEVPDTGIRWIAGAATTSKIVLFNVLDVDNNSFDGSKCFSADGSSVSSQNMYGFEYKRFLDSRGLRDNGGWVETLALTQNLFKGQNSGEATWDARGYLFHDMIYDASGRQRDVYRSVGAYQFDAAVVWNANNNHYYLDVQSAVNAAKAGEELQLVGSRISSDFFTAPGASSDVISIGRDLIILGQGMGKTVLDGDGTTQIFQIKDKNASRIFVYLGGMDLINGKADQGGAIYNTENLVLVQVGLYDNVANQGGAIYNNGGYVVAERVTMGRNTAEFSGGAIYSTSSAAANANLLVRLSDLRDNVALHGDGGAIYQKSYGDNAAGMVVDGSLFAYNVASGSGSAISTQGVVSLNNTTVAFNKAGDGSALDFNYVSGKGKWNLTNVSVAWNENSSGTVTGALAVDGGALVLVNTVVAMNNITYDVDGVTAGIGDIWKLNAQGTKIGGVNFKFANSVFQYRPNQSELTTSNPANAAWQYDPENRFTVVDQDVTGFLGGDALFDYQYQMNFGDYSKPVVRWAGRLEDRGGWTETLALKESNGDFSTLAFNGLSYYFYHNSKLINLGINAGAHEYDQRGYLVNGTRDIGAFESHGFIGEATYYNPKDDKNVTIGIESINDVNGFSKNHLLSGNAAEDLNTEVGFGAHDETALIGQAFKDITITLANTRVIDYDIQLNTMWSEYLPEGGETGGARTITIYGAAEGGTVLDADSRGSLFTAWGGFYRPPNADPVYVMGHVKFERLTLTGAVSDYGSVAVTKENYTPDGGSISFKDVNVIGNISTKMGGALYTGVGGDADMQKTSVFQISNSLFAYNMTAGSGGAIFSTATVNVSNSTLAYNTALGVGGGIAVSGEGAASTFDGVTIAYNEAISSLGGAGMYYSGSSLSISNTLIAKNRSSDAQGTYDYAWYAGTLTQFYNLVEHQMYTYYSGEGASESQQGAFAPRGDRDTTTHLIAGALLGVSNNLFATGYVADHGGWTGTIALSQYSAAIDAGGLQAGTDQRGYEYASGNKELEFRDVGAFELNGAFISVTNSAGKTERFNDFSLALAWADKGSTLTVNAVRVRAHDIEIDKSVTIQLNGAAEKGSFPLTRGEHAYIDAQFKGRVFNISNSQAEVGISGLGLYNGMTLMASADAPTQAAGNGGLIYNSGILTLTNVTASYGFAQQFGGGIFSSKSLNIVSDGSFGLLPSSFNNNQAVQGGAIFARGGLSISGAWAKERVTNVVAGVNLNSGSVQFRNNSADEGGAIFVSNLTTTGKIAGAYFAGNLATNQGGAIYANRNVGLTLMDSYLLNNRADGEGAALYVSGGSLLVEDSAFRTNVAMQSGGALFAVGVDTITLHALSKAVESGVFFWNNTAVYGSGGATYLDGFNHLSIYADSLLREVYFSQNQSIHGNGGAIYAVNGVNVSIGNDKANNNIVYFYGNTAGVHDRNSQAKNATNNGSGAANDVMNEFSSGGAFYGKNISTVSFSTNVTFEDNAAFTYGGALYLEHVGSFATQKNIDFLYNLAGHSGGNKWDGVFGKGGMAAANGAGGGAYLLNVEKVSLDYTQIAGNYAGFSDWNKVFKFATNAAMSNGELAFFMNGGGFHITTDSAEVPAPIITMNDLDVYDNNRILVNRQVTLGGSSKGIRLAETTNALGGAFYIDTPNGVLTVTNSGFDSNEAGLGGAFYLAGTTAATAMRSVSFTNVTFGDNFGTALRINALTESLALNFVTFGYNRVINDGMTGTSGMYFGGFVSGVADAKFSLSIKNSIFFEEAGTPVEFGKLPLAEQLTVVSAKNIYYRFDSFKGADVLTSGDRNDIYAYNTNKYGQEIGSIKISGVLDANGNIVGSDASNKAIKDNLYLSKEMAYHANYLTRALALESANSIAYHYKLSAKGTEVRPGDAGDVAVDQRGNVRTGLVVDSEKDADGNLIYTYKFYLFNAEEKQWYFVKVTEGQEPELTAVAKPAGTSLGAFEPNFYMVVTSNLDNRTNGFNFIKEGVEEWHDISTALTGMVNGEKVFTDGGMTLREALYWMDNYTLNGVNNSAGKFVFDPNRYVKFSDRMFSDNRNQIKLESGQIIVKQDVIVGMVDNYEGLFFKADGTFMAQDSAGRITISGQDQSRIFYVDHSEDVTIRKMRDLTDLFCSVSSMTSGVRSGIKVVESVNEEIPYVQAMAGGLQHNATLGLNNLTLTDGYQGFWTRVSASGSAILYYNDAGRGGAIFNEGNLILNNVVIKDSVATNADFDPDYDIGSYAGWGGGIFNDRKLSIAGMKLYSGAETYQAYYLMANGVVRMYDTTINGNVAEGRRFTAETTYDAVGGGIANVGDMLIVRSTISNNQADGSTHKEDDPGFISALGGGIFSGSYTFMDGGYVASGRLTMYSSTVTGNWNSHTGEFPWVYTGGGSALHIGGGQAILVGNTIAYNIAERFGNGMGYAFALNSYMRDGKFNYILANNIIANNYVDGISPVVGRDMLVGMLSTQAPYTIGGNNIIGSIFGIVNSIGNSWGNNSWGRQDNGYVDKLYLSNQLKYNGGMTQNLRLGANSIAYTLNNGEEFADIYQPGMLRFLDNAFKGNAFADAFYDQRGLGEWGFGLVDGERVPLFFNPVDGKWYAADGVTEGTLVGEPVQKRNTIGAYEMLTYVNSDTSVADQQLIGGDIRYDYSFVGEDGQHGRNGWNVNLRQGLYLADQNATVVFTVATQQEVKRDSAGNIVYKSELSHFGEKMVEMADKTDAAGNKLYFDNFELVYGEMNIFNSLTFRVDANGSDGLTIDAVSRSRAFKIDGSSFEVANSTPLKVVIESVGAQLLVLNTAATGASPDLQQGGAIYSNGHLTLKNIDFRNSSATGSGGAIYVANGDLVLNHVNFNRKAVTSDVNYDHGVITAGGDGGAVYVEGAANFKNVTMYFTTAKGDGGAVYVANALTASRFENVTIGDKNAAVGMGGTAENGNGGAIYFVGSDLMLKNVFIANSSAATTGDTSYGLGGAIYINSSGNVVMGTDEGHGVTMINNSAVSGGAIYVANAKLFQMKQGSIVNNSAVGYPGAFGNGGGIYISGATGMTIKFLNTTIANNTAVGNGGGLYVGNGDVTLTSTTIANNIAGYMVQISVPSDRYFGGGLYLGAGKLTMDNSIVAQNFANYGKSIADAVKPGSGAIRDDIFVDNYRGSFGAMTYSIIGTLSGKSKLVDVNNNPVDVTGSARMGDGLNGTTKWKELSLMTSVYEFKEGFTIDGRVEGATIPTYIVYVYSDLGGKGGNDLYINSLDQLGRPRDVGPGEITMGAYQKVTIFFSLGNGDGSKDWVANIGTNWFNLKTGEWAKDDSIFMLPDAVFQVNSVNAIISATYNNGAWYVGELGKAELNGAGKLAIEQRNQMTGLLDVNDQATLRINTANANIANMVFTVNSFDTLVNYGRYADMLRSLEYGFLSVESFGTHNMTVDSDALIVRRNMTLVGLDTELGNTLNLTTSSGKALALTVDETLFIGDGIGGAMVFNLPGSVSAHDVVLTAGKLAASGNVNVAEWISGTGVDSAVSGAEISFGSITNVGSVAAIGDIKVKMAGGSQVIDSNLQAGGNITFANNVAFSGAVAVAADGNIAVNGTTLVNSGTFAMTAGGTMTLDGNVSFGSAVTTGVLTAQDLLFKGGLEVSGGKVKTTAKNSMSFNGYAHKLAVNNNARLDIVIEGNQNLYLVGDDSFQNKNPLFDVRNMVVGKDAYLNLSTKGELVIGEIAGTAADFITGTLELNSGKIITIGEGNKPLEFNFATLIFGTDVEVAGQLVSIDYGMEFKGSVAIRDGIGNVEFISKYGMVNFYGELQGNGGNVTVSGKQVRLNAITNVNDLKVGATGTDVDDTITLSSAVAVTGDIVLESNNPIQVIGDSALEGHSLNANAPLVGSGSLRLSFADDVESIISAISIDGVLTFAKGTYTIGSITAGGLVNRAVVTVASAVQINGNAVNSGTFTAQKQMNVTGSLTNETTGVISVASDLTVGGSLNNAGELHVDGKITVGGDLVTDGVFVANEDLTVNGSLTNSGEFTALGDVNVGANLTNNGTFAAVGSVDVVGNLTSSNNFSAENVQVGGDLTSSGIFAVVDTIAVGGGIVANGLISATDIRANGSIVVNGSITAQSVMTKGDMKLNASASDIIRIGVAEALGSVTVTAAEGALVSFKTLSAVGDMALTGNMTIADRLTSGNLTTSGNIVAGSKVEVTGNWINNGTVSGGDAGVTGNLTSNGTMTLNSLAIAGNLAINGALSVKGAMELNGRERQQLDFQSGTVTVGSLEMNNAKGADLVGSSVLNVAGSFTFAQQASMGLGNGRLNIGGAIVGNSREAYFMADGSGMVYLNLSNAALPGGSLWIGDRDHVGNVVMSSKYANHIVGVGTSSPVTSTGSSDGKPLYDPAKAYSRQITIDTSDLDLNINLSEAFEAEEVGSKVKDAVLYAANSKGKWQALKQVGENTYVVNTDAPSSVTYAQKGYDFSPNPPPPPASAIPYNLYQRGLRDEEFVSASVREPLNNQYKLSLENMRMEWISNAETNPLNIQLERSGSAMATPVRLGLLGGDTVYGSPIDDTLLDDGVLLNPEASNRLLTIQRDQNNDRADWMEAFATLAERDDIQERHPAFQDSVDRALEAFLMA